MDWLELQSVSLEEPYNWVRALASLPPHACSSILSLAPAAANPFISPETLPDHLVYTLTSKGKVKKLRKTFR